MSDRKAEALVDEYARRKKHNPYFGIDNDELRRIVEETNNQREDMYVKYAFMAGYKAALKAARGRVNDLLDPGRKQYRRG